MALSQMPGFKVGIYKRFGYIKGLHGSRLHMAGLQLSWTLLL